MVVVTAAAALFSESIPVIDLSSTECKPKLIQACEEFGFFKVINHGVPNQPAADLESEAIKFFSLPPADKHRFGPAEPFGYGKNRIGRNGDVGWIEYLLLTANPQSDVFERLSAVEQLRCATINYLSGVKKMTCEILEMVAEELKIEPRNALSRLVMDEQSDSYFRINHYPPTGGDLIGFGEHTDPQIIAVLRSNNTPGLQIQLKNGKWISVPSDVDSFFINVGDSLQVMTNGRFRSVRHRVVANSPSARLSMIYLGGPPLSEKIMPLVGRGEDRVYKEFTWSEYKKYFYSARLADNRLGPFQNTIAASS